MHIHLPQSRYSLPLVLSVTGHRDLRPQDIPTLEAKVSQILDELRKDYPMTPLLLLSQLAEGADQLVARVALDSGARLGALLPMPQSVYVDDFCSKESRSEFDGLLSRSEFCIELPLAKDNSLEEISKAGPARDRQYELAGAYMVRHSQILIALWDGAVTKKVGGTWQVVTFKLKGIPQRDILTNSPLDPIESGPVYHITTPRLSNPDSQLYSIETRKYFTRNLPESSYSQEIPSIKPKYNKKSSEEDTARKSFNRVLKRIDLFNRDAQRLVPKLQETTENARASLLPEKFSERLPARPKAMRDRFAICDVLALHFQRRLHTTLALVFTFGLLAVCLFQLYSGPLACPVILRLYVGALAMAAFFYAWEKWSAYQKKYLDYRALAEGLRVQFFWDFAGIEEKELLEKHICAADHYLRRQRDELDWIRQAIRTWSLTHTEDRDSIGHSSGSCLDLIKTHWIHGQFNYFRAAKERNASIARNMTRWAGVLLTVGLAMAAWLLIDHSRLVAVQINLDQNFSVFLQCQEYSMSLLNLAIGAVSLCFASAAALGGYSEVMAFSRHAREYQRMGIFFGRALEMVEKEIAEHRDDSAAQRLLLELGKEALEETGDWVLMHRERPMSLPM